MAKVTIKGFAYARDYDGRAMFYFMDSECMEEHGFVLIGPHEIIIDVPDDFPLLPAHIANLERRRQKAQEELARVDAELFPLLAAKPSAAHSA